MTNVILTHDIWHTSFEIFIKLSFELLTKINKVGFTSLSMPCFTPKANHMSTTYLRNMEEKCIGIINSNGDI